MKFIPLRTNLTVERPQRLCFCFCGFNVAIISGLFIKLPELLASVRPRLVMVANTLHKKSRTLAPEKLDLPGGYSTVQTGQNGWIHLTTDGKQLWAEVERR